MPDKKNLNLVLGNNVTDLKQIRLPGLDKPFEKLTVSELVQLRPGSQVADSYGVNAVTDNISVSTSSMLEELGQIQKVRTMQKVAHQARLDDLRSTLATGSLATRVKGLSAEQPGPSSVALPPPEEDVFSTEDKDPLRQVEMKLKMGQRALASTGPMRPAKRQLSPGSGPMMGLSGDRAPGGGGGSR